jgi:hypothetical protein
MPKSTALSSNSAALKNWVVGGGIPQVPRDCVEAMRGVAGKCPPLVCREKLFIVFVKRAECPRKAAHPAKKF